MLVLMTTIFLLFILFNMWFLISSKEKENQMMNSSFESGFESSYFSFIPFSSQYFMVAMLFLIFDLEIVLTMPSVISMNMCLSKMLISLFIIFLFILLMIEMKISTIEWLK